MGGCSVTARWRGGIGGVGRTAGSTTVAPDAASSRMGDSGRGARDASASAASCASRNCWSSGGAVV